MGKGKSSDVYYYTLHKVNGREFTGTLRPTGAGGIYLPNGGEETLFLMIFWEILSYEERYRVKKSGSYGGHGPLNAISRWAREVSKNMNEDERNKWDVFGEWKKLDPEIKKPYEDAYIEETVKTSLEWYKTMEERKIPPICEISVDDICSSYLAKMAPMYIQSVTLIDSSGYDEDQINQQRKKKKKKGKKGEEVEVEPEDYITGTYRIILTDEKWGCHISTKGHADGTTAYEQRREIPHWNKNLHVRFPKPFRVRVKVLLMMRLKRHKGNFIYDLPEGVFYNMISFLARASYNERGLQEWADKMEPSKEKNFFKAPSPQLIKEIFKLKDVSRNTNSVSWAP